MLRSIFHSLLVARSRCWLLVLQVRRDVLDFVTLERRLDMMTVKGKEEEDAGPEVSPLVPASSASQAIKTN